MPNHGELEEPLLVFPESEDQEPTDQDKEPSPTLAEVVVCSTQPQSGEDGTEKNRLTLDGRTELEYTYPLHDGENKLEVTVYNVNDVSETSRVKLTK